MKTNLLAVADRVEENKNIQHYLSASDMVAKDRDRICPKENVQGRSAAADSD